MCPFWTRSDDFPGISVYPLPDFPFELPSISAATELGISSDAKYVPDSSPFASADASDGSPFVPVSSEVTVGSFPPSMPSDIADGSLLPSALVEETDG